MAENIKFGKETGTDNWVERKERRQELRRKVKELGIGFAEYNNAEYLADHTFTTKSNSFTETNEKTDILLLHVLKEHVERQGEGLLESLGRHLRIIDAVEQDLFPPSLRS